MGTQKKSSANRKPATTGHCPFGNDVGLLLRAVNNQLNAELTKQLVPLQLTCEQWTVLYCIGVESSCTPQSLLRALCVDRATVSRRLGPLERRGLVSRSPDPSDQRFHRLTLTGDGKRLNLRASRIAQRINDQALNVLSAADSDLLNALLQRIFTGNLERKSTACSN